MLDRAEAEARTTAANLAASQQLIAGAQAGLAQAKAEQDSTLATLPVILRRRPRGSDVVLGRRKTVGMA